MNTSGPNGIFDGLEIFFDADATDEANILHDKICPLILSEQF